MRVTPEQAKDVRCPLRVDGIYCIGIQCMAWRWVTDVSLTPETEGRCGMAGPLDPVVYPAQKDASRK